MPVEAHVGTFVPLHIILGSLTIPAVKSLTQERCGDAP